MRRYGGTLEVARTISVVVLDKSQSKPWSISWNRVTSTVKVYVAFAIFSETCSKDLSFVFCIIGPRNVGSPASPTFKIPFIRSSGESLSKFRTMSRYGLFLAIVSVLVSFCTVVGRNNSASKDQETDDKTSNRTLLPEEH